MALFNDPDFFTSRPLDFENKLVLPTIKLYEQVHFKLNGLYQDVRNTMIDWHSTIAAESKQVYQQPVETITAWYESLRSNYDTFYVQAQQTLLPIHQQWQIKLNNGREQTVNYFQAFWNDPEKVAMATIDPLVRQISSATGLLKNYLQIFLDNPEQFLQSAFSPLLTYLNSLSEDAMSTLLSTYSALAELFKLLMSQPSVTFQAIYQNALSSLLDVYFSFISSLMTMS